jgi:hypothetical protein
MTTNRRSSTCSTLFTFSRFWLLVAVCGMSASPATAQTPCAQAELTVNGASTTAEVGFCVAVDGEWAVVGATRDDRHGNEAGAAFVFRRVGGQWTFAHELLRSDASTEDYYGWSAAIHGNTIVVGAVGDAGNGANSGSAYVFAFDGLSWSQSQKLVPPTHTTDGMYGNSVALDGERIVVGAPWLPYPPDETGLVHVYTNNGTQWVREQTIAANDPTIDAQFGYSVAIDGERLAIGARWDTDLGIASGSAYVFRRSGTTWTQERKVLASDGSASDEFGAAVALRGDTLIVGAPRPWHGTGAAYEFRRNGSQWTQVQRFSENAGSTNETFGHSLVLSDEWMLIGAPQSFVGPGVAYAYRRVGSGFDAPTPLTPTSALGGAGWFGKSLALAGDQILIGAFGADIACDGVPFCDEGAFYVFATSGCGCPGDLDGDGSVGIADLAILLSRFGVSEGATSGDGDSDGDGDVDIADLAALLGLFGGTCG